MTSEPIRLLDDGDLTDAERALLTAGRASAPVDYDVIAGATRFRAELAALAAAGAVTAAGAEATRSGTAGVVKGLLAKLGVKIALGVAATVTFAGVGFVVGKHAANAPVTIVVAPPQLPKATSALAPVVPAAPAAPVLAVSPTAAPASASASAPAPASAPASAPAPLHASTSRHATPSAPARADKGPARQAEAPPETSSGSSDGFSGATGATTEVAEARVAPTAAPAPPPSAPPSAAALPPAPPTPASDSVSEIRGVALARNLVDSDPEAALNLLEKVRRDHPNGYFVEERQALTVIALARLGRESAVRQQAAAFLRAYPNGPFSDRVRSVAAAAR
jgi:hypothetical protein